MITAFNAKYTNTFSEMGRTPFFVVVVVSLNCNVGTFVLG